MGFGIPKNTEIMNNRIIVAGSVNIDISGTPTAPLVARDSNPGTIRMSTGGVGWNIAANLAHLGLEVNLITALGDDRYATMIRRQSRILGVDLRRALHTHGRATSVYLCLNDEKGDMQVAINDMSLYEQLTPSFWENKLEEIHQNRLLVLDANLPAAAISYLAKNCQVPILAEPVSTIKAPRLLPVLDKLFLLKPNRMEAQVLSGVRIEREDDLPLAADRLLARGVRHVLISLGSEGVYYAGGTVHKKYPVFPGSPVNTTGCGDAFLAGCAWGLVRNLDMDAIVRAGLAAAAVCLQAPEAVSPLMSEKLIRQMIGR
jgi:pseudouridine kinase